MEGKEEKKLCQNCKKGEAKKIARVITKAYSLCDSCYTAFRLGLQATAPFYSQITASKVSYRCQNCGAVFSDPQYIETVKEHRVIFCSFCDSCNHIDGHA